MSLILQIVDGVDDARAASTHQIGVAGAQEGGTGSGLPIVEVEDVRREAEHRQAFPAVRGRKG